MKKLYFLLFLFIFYAPVFSLGQNAEKLFGDISNSACSVSVNVVNPISCYGVCDRSVIATSTGTAPFYYSWMPGGCSDSICSNLCAGTYTVTLIDSTGCVDTATIVLTQLPLLKGTIVSSGPVCANGGTGSYCITPTGGTPPYTYQWSNGNQTPCVTALFPGSYCTLVTDTRGCTDTVCSVVATYPPINPYTTKQDPTCNGCMDGWAQVNMGGGFGPFMYSWSTVPSQTTQSVSGLSSGTYTVCVTDAAGCIECTTVVLVDSGVFVSEINKAGIISIYPNPARNEFSISFNKKLRDASVEFFDVMGRKMDLISYSAADENGEMRFHIDVRAGIYFLRVMDGERIYTEKLIIN